MIPSISLALINIGSDTSHADALFGEAGGVMSLQEKSMLRPHCNNYYISKLYLKLFLHKGHPTLFDSRLVLMHLKWNVCLHPVRNNAFE